MSKKIPWTEIKAKYLAGEKPKKLSDDYAKFKLTPKQISDKANRENWKKQKTKLSEEIDHEIEKLVKEHEINRNALHLEAFDLIYKKLIESINKGTYQIVAGKNPKIIDLDNGIEQLKKAAEALEKIQRGQRLAEGVLNEFDKQKLEIEKAKLKDDSQNEPSEEDKQAFLNAMANMENLDGDNIS